MNAPMPSWVNDGPPIVDRSHIPTGRYKAVMIESHSTFVHTAYQDGNVNVRYQVYVLEFMLVDGLCAGLRIRDYIHGGHPDPRVRDVEYARLSQLCHGVGMVQIGKASSELHGRTLELEIVTVGAKAAIMAYWPHGNPKYGPYMENLEVWEQ